MPGRKLRVDMDEIADAMNNSSREINDFYLDTQTGKLLALDTDLLRRVEDGEPLDDIPEWMKQDIPIAKAIGRPLPQFGRSHPAQRLPPLPILELRLNRCSYFSAIGTSQALHDSFV